VAHHDRDRAAGASGATLSLGDALAAQGCEVSYFFYDDAFGGRGGSELSRMIRFPWHVDRHLSRTAHQFDVVDAATGDAWVWARRGRRGGARTTLVTRTHGLEHVADEVLRERARAGEVTLSHKYPVYHGGFHLWEVRQSLVRADAQILPHALDFDYATQWLGVHPDTASIVPNGVADRLLAASPVSSATMDGPISLAFIGSWIPRKGIRDVVEMTRALVASGTPFTLQLLGTGLGERDVLGAFPEAARANIVVVPRYEPEALPGLLARSQVLVYSSWTEGFSLALIEGMASGLAPVAAPTGPATTVIRDGDNGLLVRNGTGENFAAAVTRLAHEPRLLAGLRIAARRSVQAYRWSTIAAATIGVYRAAIARRSGGTA
jgi:glycosyltransferase involved in cell wall biosynthesis